MLITLSGVSGSGKTTITKLLVDQYSFSILPSYTTRERRASESPHSNYEHIDARRFLEMETSGEWALTSQYAGNSYGTRRADLVQAMSSAHPVVADLSLQSVQQMMTEHGINAKSYFLYVDKAVALQRMQDRGDVPAVISRRAELYEQQTLGALAFLASGASLQVIDAVAAPSRNAERIARGNSALD
ncbi:hypothetical protein ACQKGC_28750 [Allorhizobium pseudoryzae]|uniref:hypothetical protein n=1 Tax=Allorhizobium pseudoryzae TaxID=379684 RepID=UPI003D075BDD